MGKRIPIERFWLQVDKTPTCWLWTGHRRPDGYGQFNCPRPNLAHRWMWIALHGPLPDGAQLDHLCRVRHCVNPDHLEPVTSQVNTLRGFGPSAENARKTHCVNGHEFTADNTIIRSDNGGRRCRTCQLAIETKRSPRSRRVTPTAKKPPAPDADDK